MEFDEIIQSLKDDLLDLNEGVQTIQAKADAEQRELTEDEAEEVERLQALFEKKDGEIERRMKSQEQAKRLQASLGRKTDPEGPEEVQAKARERVPARVRSEDHGKWGWRSFGEFAAGVRSASAMTGTIDPRLIANAPTTYGSEGIGEDGGFAVPPDFRTAIMEKVMGEESLLSRTDQLTTSSNSITFPADETTPWASSGGIQAYWADEGAQLTQSKPSLTEKQLRLNKLTALIPVTEELLGDASSLDGYLRRRVPEKFDFKIQDAIINGSGAGQPVGILNSNALVSVAKDTGTSPVQAADTIRFKNITDMWNRLYGPCRANAVWLINQDIEGELYQMAFDPTATSKTPVYLPPGGASASPYGTLMGRPVVPVQGCQTLGDKGDIILADLTKYLTVTKTGGVRADVSIHLYFDYDMSAYRFIMRVAGMPWWNSAISPANGSNTMSCFVTLDERA